MKSPLNLFGFTSLLIAGTGLALSCFSANAAPLVYEQNFDGTAGSFPSDWSRTTNGVLGTDGQIEENGAGQLEVTRLTASTAGSVLAAYYTGSFGSIDLGIVSDVVIRSTILNLTSDQKGILARTEATTFDPDGYYAYFTGADLVIAKDPPGANNTVLATTATTLVSNTYYTLEFSLTGTTLKASLFEVGGTTALYSVNVTDASYTSGYAGLRSRVGAADRSDFYDSLSIAPIPEPGVAQLSVISGLCLISFLMLKRQRTLRVTKDEN